MERRDFIKNSICLSCVGLLASGCKDIITDNKFTNDYNMRKKMNAFLIKSKDDLPKKVRLEACSMCQLDCAECTVRKQERNGALKKLGYLKFDDFKKFVDDNDFIEKIELSNKGEIFLNPELDAIIKYAYKKGVKLTADNGVNLNTVSEKTLENLVKYKFRLLKVSIDGATSETYKIYRRGGDFNKVIDNIKKINYFKKKYNSEFPKLTWQFILFGHNEHEIELAKKLAKKLDMEIDFKRNYAPRYSPVKNVKLVEKQTGLKINNKGDNFFGCKLLFSSPQIDYDGVLLGCTRATNINFGVNVFKQGLLDSLNADKYLYAKSMLSDVNTPPRNEIFCSHCDQYEKLKKLKYKIS